MLAPSTTTIVTSNIQQTNETQNFRGANTEKIKKKQENREKLMSYTFDLPHERASKTLETDSSNKQWVESFAFTLES